MAKVKHLENTRKTIEKVPAKELQKVVLSNLVLAQFDMKWDNVAVEDDGTTRPYDNGAGFPTKEVLVKRLWQNSDGGKKMFGDTLCFDMTWRASNDPPLLKQATEPMDSDLVKQFLDIDPEAVEKSAKEERSRRKQSHGLDESLLSDESIGFPVISITAAQNVLRPKREKPLTQVEFLKAFTEELQRLFPASNWKSRTRVLRHFNCAVMRSK